MNNTYQIYLISDSTGETLERIFMALKTQFINFKYNVQQFSFTRTENQIKKIVDKAKKNENSIILYTIVDNKLAKILKDECVEIHTGKLCDLVNKNINTKYAYNNLKKTALFARKNGLDVHAGHGITYKSAYKLSKIKYISEFNIGHFVISESLFIGLDSCIKKFKKIINS